jgi:hypothetical protein
MTVPERNKMIAECVSEFQEVHDKYFPRGKPLEDEDWTECVKAMDSVAAKYRKDIPTISGKLCMAFLDDIEEYHKKWIDHLKGNN